MNVNFESLGIHQLSVMDRLELIERIWESLPEQLEPQEVPEWHLAELALRLKRLESEPGIGKPWREVLDRLESKP